MSLLGLIYRDLLFKTMATFATEFCRLILHGATIGTPFLSSFVACRFVTRYRTAVALLLRSILVGIGHTSDHLLGSLLYIFQFRIRKEVFPVASQYRAKMKYDHHGRSHYKQYRTDANAETKSCISDKAVY